MQNLNYKRVFFEQDDEVFAPYGVVCATATKLEESEDFELLVLMSFQRERCYQVEENKYLIVLYDILEEGFKERVKYVQDLVMDLGIVKGIWSEEEQDLKSIVDELLK